ncbi:hypothetical protein HDV64DRAFT_247880 [Trichoderma sp. TUCIM 5745]
MASGKECEIYEIRRLFVKPGSYSRSFIAAISENHSLRRLYSFSLPHPLPKYEVSSYIYSTHRHPFIHDPAVNSTSGWLAEHGCSRLCTSSPIRRLCRSNYVSVVHKPVATCYPNSLGSDSPWHDPLPLLQSKNKACRGLGSRSVRVQLWPWL